MTTALDPDLAALVGELEDVPCEGTKHGVELDVHGGPAVQYTRLHCPMCGPQPIKAMCAPFVEFVRQENNGVVCPECWNASHAPETVEILGPVHG